MKKPLTVMLVAALVAAAFVAPAEAGKRKKKKVCKPYAAGEMGAEAESVVVTDAATEEEPLIHEFSLDFEPSEGLLDAVGVRPVPASYVNVQVDSKAKAAGLYATFEFPEYRDYDLYGRWSTGEEAASSHGFNPLINTQGSPADQSNTATNHAGETTASSENIIGLTTPDCGGYTFEMLNYLGEGGDFELKLWLGEAQNEPLAPGEGG